MFAGRYRFLLGRRRGNIVRRLMRQETSVQERIFSLVSILFRVFKAMNCGAILLDAEKRILRLNGLGLVGIRDFHLCWAVIHASDGTLCADGRPMGEDGVALS